MSLIPILKNNKLLVDDFWNPKDTLSSWITLAPENIGGYEFEHSYDGEDLILSCDIPGVKIEDVQLELEGSSLRVNAVRRGTTETRQYRMTSVPKQYDLESAEATLELGVLNIRFKKLPSAIPRKISIKSSK